MNVTFKSITYIILIFSTMLLSQRGGRGGFNSANMPKIGVLQGIVVDSVTTKPIPYASISVLNMRSNEIVTGGITNESGSFYIKEIPMGMYNVVVEFIGYEKITIGSIKLFPGDGGGVEQDLGTIAMELSAVQMQEVDVYGEIPNMIYTVDKRIFDAKKDMTLVGGTGSDALKKIPSVDVDIDGNVTLRGDGNVTILLDGRPMRGDRRSMVEDLPADMIDRIEVITNPSAKYDPDGMAGIINIILKRGRFEGMNGSTTITAGEYSRYNLSGMFNYRRDKFNFFTNGSYRLWNSSGGGNRLFQYVYPTATNETRQRTEGYREPVSNNIKLGTDYYYDKNTMFTIAMTYKQYDRQDEEKVFYYNPEYLFESEEFDKGTDLDFEFGYYKDFPQKDRKLVFEASSTINNDEGYEHAVSNLSSLILTDTHDHSVSDPFHKEENNNIIIKTDYTHPFGQSSKFEAGFKSTMKQFKTDQYYLHSIYDSDYKEDVHALYGTLLYNFTDQFGVQLGARAEQALTSAILGNAQRYELDTTNIFLYMMENAVGQSPFNNDYFKIYPSVNMLYNLNPTQRVQFGFSKRVNRPRRRTLTPFPQSTNNTSFIRTGNPYLKPEYSDVVDLNFSSNSRKLTLNTGVYYSHLTDNISWWDRDYIVFQDTTYEVMGSDNAGKSERNGIEFFINYRPMPLIMFMMSVNTWNSRTYDSGESDLNGNSKGYFAWGSSMITIPMIGRLDISGRYRGPMKITTGEINPSLTLNLSFQRKFVDNKLTMIIKVRDLLDNSKFSIETEEQLIDQISLESYTRIMEADRRRDKRSVSLSLSYSFGKMQQKRRMNRDREGFGGGGMDMSY